MSLVGKMPEVITMMMKLESLIDVSKVTCVAGNVLTPKT